MCRSRASPDDGVIYHNESDAWDNQTTHYIAAAKRCIQDCYKQQQPEGTRLEDWYHGKVGEAVTQHPIQEEENFW